MGIQLTYQIELLNRRYLKHTQNCEEANTILWMIESGTMRKEKKFLSLPFAVSPLTQIQLSSCNNHFIFDLTPKHPLNPQNQILF